MLVKSCNKLKVMDVTLQLASGMVAKGNLLFCCIIFTGLVSFWKIGETREMFFVFSLKMISKSSVMVLFQPLSGFGCRAHVTTQFVLVSRSLWRAVVWDLFENLLDITWIINSLHNCIKLESDRPKSTILSPQSSRLHVLIQQSPQLVCSMTAQSITAPSYAAFLHCYLVQSKLHISSLLLLKLRVPAALEVNGIHENQLRQATHCILA